MLQYILFCIGLAICFVNVFAKNIALSAAAIALMIGATISSINTTGDIYLQMAAVIIATGELIRGFLLIFKHKGA